ncbi:MAG: SIR2 family protein [Sphingomonas sp.]|jgi:tetratricopeptide (TPR) repeat protein|uniref:SIR2 family protein n=1 Tax=Sphingomonas sp. TaxID=28214 RepID=UPI00356B14DA
MAQSDPLEDRKLREEALKAFVKALHTDRMVAITGAMSTRAYGYPSWGEFITASARVARRLAVDIIARRRVPFKHDLGEPSLSWRPAGRLLLEICTRARKLERGRHHGDARVALWTLHDCFRRLDQQMRLLRSGLVINNEYQKPALDEFERRVARIFASRTYGVAPLAAEPAAAAIRPLIASLGIKRIATFNYDLELERAFMLRQDERDTLGVNEKLRLGRLAAIAPQGSSPAELFAIKAGIARKDFGAGEKIASTKDFIGPPNSGKPIVRINRTRLTRTLGNGITVESDVVDRERSDRLFEFAVGSAEIDRHILHLHGRADVPMSMVANIRQYDRLYRLDDLHRDPFDHGLRVLFGGNPLLFVGLGMEEPELKQFLQYSVSNMPIRRPAPMFLLWNTVKWSGDAVARDARMRDLRLEFLTMYGVHILFDEDLRSPGEDDWVAPLRRYVPSTEERLRNRARRMDSATSQLLSTLDAIMGNEEAPDPRLWPRMRELVRADAQRVALEKANDGGHDIAAINLEADRNLLRALVDTMERLPALVERVDRRLHRPGNWRTIDPRLLQTEGQAKPVRLYGSRSTRTTARRLLSSLNRDAWLPNGALEHPNSPRSPDNLVIAITKPGYGRGTLAEYLGQMQAVHLLDGENSEPDETASTRGIGIGNALLRWARPENRMIVNAGFSYDSDTMLVGIARFLQLRCPAIERGAKISREQGFTDGLLLRTSKRTLVIINGADRFFSLGGVPLSAELDQMLRSVRRPGGNVQVLLLGTDRLRHYAKAIGVPFQTLPEPTFHFPWLPKGGAGQEDAGQEDAGQEDARISVDSHYFHAIEDGFADRRAETLERIASDMAPGPRRELRLKQAEVNDAGRALVRRAITVDREAQSRAFFDAHLTPSLLQALYVRCPAAFEILRTMSFIGGPIEAGVLLFAPKIRAILAEESAGDSAGTDRIADTGLKVELCKVMDQLRALGLVTVLEPHDPTPDREGARQIVEHHHIRDGYREALKGSPLWRRYALHRSLTTFLRDRHGAPINDAKLATTFNMSLFMSDPSENYTPEPNFHDELGELVDSLIGGWHDIPRFFGPHGYTLPGDPSIETYRSALRDLYIHPGDERHAWETLNHRSSRVAAACLRGALALVRNYYSTGALLKLDREKRIANAQRDGALTEHAHRLDRLITAFGDVSIARTIMKSMFAAAADGSPEGDWDNFRRVHMGPDPFYADDLVWLHNERGVVALTQGNLFDARDALSAAAKVNTDEVEFGYHGHNWRRIAINQVATKIERGMLRPAERQLDQIEDTIGAAPTAPGSAGTGSEHIARVRAIFLGDAPPVHGDESYSRETVLMTAMTIGYRGLIAHLNGRHLDAQELYSDAIRIFQRLNEQRALAHFQRHLALLVRDRAKSEGQINDAIRAAQSAQQMDILHRARVVRADFRYRASTDPVIRSRALQQIKSALRYAALADCYRLRIEASASLARHMRESGDYDTALRYATDALTIASRYGHGLHKTLLRIEIAQILIARGDPMSGEALLEQAIQIASGKGYYLALERVRRARVDHAARRSNTHRADIPISG